MKTLIILLFGLFIFGQAAGLKNFAQKVRQEESILNEWADLPDSVKIKKLSDLCWKNRGSDPEKALLYGNMAYDLAIKQKKNHEAAQILNYIGVVHRNRGNYLLSLDYYNRALKLAKKIKDDVQTAYSYNNIGGIYRLQSNYPMALENIFKAMKIFENRGDKRGIAFCQVNAAIIYRKQKKYQKAKGLFEEIIKTREELGDKAQLALAKNLLGTLYFDMENYDRALSIYQEVLVLYEQIGDQLGIASSYVGIGSVYYKQKKYRLSLVYRNRALSIHKKIGNVVGEILSYQDMGMAYTYLGDYNKAKDNLEKSVKLAREINSPDEYIEGHKRLSEFYEVFGEGDAALFYYKRFAKMRDSIFTQESIDQTSALARDYELTKNRTENEILKANIERQETQRNYIVIILLLIVIFTVVVLVKNRNIRHINKQRGNLLDTKDKLFHIIAHDVKNPFQTILSYSEILKEDWVDFSDEEKKTFVNDIHTASRNVYNLLENLLKWAQSQRDQIEIKPERTNINLEIDDAIGLFSEQAKSKNILLMNEIDSELNVSVDRYTLHTVIRNLTSNALKFTKPGGKVIISAELSGGELTITVADNGVGIPRKKLTQIFDEDRIVSTDGTNRERGTGLGLMLCKDFARKNGGSLSAESEEGEGTKFKFCIPV